MLSNEIRQKFLKYFKSQGHTMAGSSPVVPQGDPTLLFINAGMNQFKDVFLGDSKRDYTRAATSQKCVRVGGKHNDLENVGHTRRHLTFFEMLGNFSFGDYFKEEAIKFAWDVSINVFEIDPKRIWPSVYNDDDEAFELWTRYVPAERIARFGASENYWSMGDTGPCGPCSELLFDRGPNYGDAIHPEQDRSGERFLEFWNLVFMQDNRAIDGTLAPLPRQSIDTGAGLERVVGLVMDVDNVFETDILRALIGQVEAITGKKYDSSDHHTASAFRVIADHVRCLSFAIADGAQPSNVDRGYVLRKILRRAVRYGRTLGMENPFLGKILPALIERMGDHYPELNKSESRIAELLFVEEESFFRTLKRGGNLLNQITERAHDHANHISGEDAFKLKDTYGFPIEEILLIAKDDGLVVDLDKYRELEEQAKELSRKAHKKTDQIAGKNIFEGQPTTDFVGFESSAADATIQAIVVDGQFIETLNVGEEGTILLTKTPFYAEMGGQVGDSGELQNQNGRFKVSDCQSPYKGISGHIGKVSEGKLNVGDTVTAAINRKKRQAIANNHTATHLLHWALHEVLGEHVKQAGSVVNSSRLRFDFSHHKSVSKEEVKQIEDLVNEVIRDNIEVKTYELPYEEVQSRSDIKQFFGDKYGSVVRVVDAEPTKELCGGTHTSATGNIGYFRILKESSIAAGVRRIEATSGKEAENFAQSHEKLLEDVSALLKTAPGKLKERLEKFIEEHKETTHELKQVHKSMRESTVEELKEAVEEVNGTPVLAKELKMEAGDVRAIADDLHGSMKAVIVLGSRTKDKGNLFVRVADELVQKGIKANEIINAIAPIIEGGGGGKADSAQAGGKAPEKLTEALDKVKTLL